MKLINTVTNEIIDLKLNNIILSIDTQKNKFCEPVNILKDAEKETYTAIEKEMFELYLTEFLRLNTDFVKLSEYKDWKHDDYDFRVIVGIEPRDIIANYAPEILVALNIERPNPKYNIGTFWEVYVNNFLNNSRPWLEQIGCIVQDRGTTEYIEPVEVTEQILNL